MNDLRDFWNKSSATIPEDKDPSDYAVETEVFFPAKSVVCDLGGGTGADSLYFAGKGHVVKLIDISNLALKKAKKDAEKRDLADLLTTYQCNLDDGVIPLATKACDVVYSRLALHYFRQDVLSKIISEVYRILKPGGMAFLTLKSPDDNAEMDFLSSTADQIEPGVFQENGYIKTRFSVSQLEQIVNTADIPAEEYQVSKLTEKLGDRKDKIKSGNTELLVNVIRLTKI